MREGTLDATWQLDGYSRVGYPPALIHVLFFKKALSTAWIVADWIIVAVTAVLMVILTDISFKELVSSL